VESPQPDDTKADVTTQCFYMKLGGTTEGKGNCPKERTCINAYIE
jgi:hypothetical protein